MRANWEDINGACTIISTTLAIAAAFNGFRLKKRPNPPSEFIIGLNYFVLFSASWVLVVIAYNWFFQPFGAYYFRLLPEQERKLYGAMLGVPALIILFYAVDQMFGRKNKEPKKKVLRASTKKVAQESEKISGPSPREPVCSDSGARERDGEARSV